MALFEVAIIQHPTKRESEDGLADKLVFGPKAVIASSEQAAAVAAVRNGGIDTAVPDERLEVLVRPF
jgi:hypothetical protein